MAALGSPYSWATNQPPVVRVIAVNRLQWGSMGGSAQSALQGMTTPSTMNWLVSVGSNAMPLMDSKCRESTSNFQDLPPSVNSFDVRQNCGEREH